MTIMGLPDNWDFSMRGMISILGEGRDAIYTAMKELVELGYCQREQIRNNGKLASTIYSFNENPETPYTDFPYTGNPPQYKRREEKIINKEVNQPQSGNSAISLAEKGKRYFRDFTELLVAHGTKEPHARSALGKLKKTYGDETVFNTYHEHAALLELKAGGAFEYFVGILKGQHSEIEANLAEAAAEKTKNQLYEELTQEKNDFFLQFNTPPGELKNPIPLKHYEHK